MKVRYVRMFKIIATLFWPEQLELVKMVISQIALGAPIIGVNS